MWVREETGHAAYGNSLYYLLHFSVNIKPVLKLKVKKKKKTGGNVWAKRVCIEKKNINDQRPKS